MRVSEEEKRKSRERILASASRLLRQRGIEGTGVADVMSDAGLTHGGFYRHFATKDALLEAALRSAFDAMLSALDARLGAGDPGAAMAAYQAHYLSQGHLEQPGAGCPVPALGGDVARGAEGLKAVFGAGVRGMIARLAKGLKGSEQARHAQAARQLAMLAGAVVIARACDRDTAHAVLSACRDAPRKV